MEQKVLFVDDEPSILSAFKRQLRTKFEIEIATSGIAGLEVLQQHHNFAVILSDMHMPGMNGLEFLAQAQEISPDSVRLMLTGNHDQDLAVKAINQGNIFRFLNKPCSIEDLTNTLEACVAQFKLITAEKELLQHTLSGSVSILTDILSTTDPASFGQGVNLRQLIRQVAQRIGVRQTWDIELAAMLANIGAIVIPGVVIERQRAAKTLTPDERAAINSIPEKGRNLLAHIPRLEGVAKIVLYQNKNYDGSGFPADENSGDKIPVGARILKTLRDLSARESVGEKRQDILGDFSARKEIYDPSIVQALIDLDRNEAEKSTAALQQPYLIKVNQLCPGQMLFSNVETSDGVLLLGKGNVLTAMVMERIQNYARFVGVREPILVDAMIPVISHKEK